MADGTTQGLVKPKVKIVGESANPFDIIRRVSNALSEAGYPSESIEQYRREATEGDIAHLLIVSARYVDTESENGTS